MFSERAPTPAAVHGTQHLDLADGISRIASESSEVVAQLIREYIYLYGAASPRTALAST